MEALEAEIAEWRSFVARGPAMNGRDLEELEDHLRSEVADLAEGGLAEDEAFLFLETEHHNDGARAFYLRHGFDIEPSVWMSRTLNDSS